MGFVNCGGLCKIWDQLVCKLKLLPLFCIVQHHRRRRFLIDFNLIIKLVQISTSTADIVSVNEKWNDKYLANWPNSLLVNPAWL